jgi:hypothetical protein
MNPPPNNCPPLCGTHTDAEFDRLRAEIERWRDADGRLRTEMDHQALRADTAFAEFEQVKVELALEKEKTVGLRWLDIQNDYIIVSLRSDAVSLASRLNEASREHDELRVTLAASQAQVARLREELKFILDECDWEEDLNGGDHRIGVACRKALSATATAAQAGKERAT